MILMYLTVRQTNSPERVLLQNVSQRETFSNNIARSQKQTLILITIIALSSHKFINP